uniref:MI domain-containing protein n=1 Tax=Octactis speculum TaxID=3111310 RepID=A0A7S2BR93_9STRA|mmetsp:Transcript_26029/g.35801  ORF Transcript_26029/g.35801 Transcript_26029/m.35801 type:complete len:974 (+) Transcript_26029:473-3394(+)
MSAKLNPTAKSFSFNPTAKTFSPSPSKPSKGGSAQKAPSPQKATPPTAEQQDPSGKPADTEEPPTTGRPRSNSSLKVSAAEWKPSGPEQAAEKANDNEPSTEEDDWEKLAVDPVLPNTGEATEKPAEKPAPVDQPVDDWETQADPNVPISVPDVPTVTKDSKVDSNQDSAPVVKPSKPNGDAAEDATPIKTAVDDTSAAKTQAVSQPKTIQRLSIQEMLDLRPGNIAVPEGLKTDSPIFMTFADQEAAAKTAAEAALQAPERQQRGGDRDHNSGRNHRDDRGGQHHRGRDDRGRDDRQGNQRGGRDDHNASEGRHGNDQRGHSPKRGGDSNADFESRRRNHKSRPAAATTYERPKWAESAGDKDVVLRKARLLLNKLTVEKFDRLSDEFMNLGFKTEELLTGIIDIIVDKAQMEQHFGAMYADLCVKLSANPIPELGDEEKGKRFRRLLLMRCQGEFELDQAAILAELEKLGDDEREEKVLLARKRYLGHMKFVGQLYRVELLSVKIMHYCIQELFGEGDNLDEEKLQCLCTLLTTIGKQLEDACANQAKQAKMMKKYIKELKSLGGNMTLSSRIRFMIRDLLEMRLNNWTARREEESAKTIAEIHDDVAREEAANAGKGGGHKGKGGNKGPQSSNRGGSSRAVSAPAKPAESDGWEMVPSTSKGRRHDSQDVRRDDRSGQGNRNQRNPAPDKNSPVNRNASGFSAVGNNAFSAFNQDEKKKKKEKNDEKRKKKEKKEKREKKEASKAAASKVAAQPKAAVVPVSAPEPTPAAAPAKAVKMTEELFRKKSEGIIEEYIFSGDAKEATECVQEMGSMDEFGWKFATDAIEKAFNKKEKEVIMIGDLLVALNAAGALSTAQIEKGLFDLIPFLKDIECDTPMASRWLGKIMAKSIVANVLSLAFFMSPDLAPPDNPEGSNASLAVDVLIETQALIQPEGLSKALQAIDGGFDLSRIAKDGEDVAKMVADAQITIP